MKYVKYGVSALVVILIVVAVIAPIGPLPGFRIGGTETAVPEAWQDTSGLHEIRLGVPGTLPRVVIIWVIDYQGDLFVVGSSESGWVKMIADGSPVQLRIEDSTYNLQATPVMDGWEPIMQAYVEKYQPDYPDIVAGFPSIDEAKGLISVFKLEG